MSAGAVVEFCIVLASLIVPRPLVYNGHPLSQLHRLLEDDHPNVNAAGRKAVPTPMVNKTPWGSLLAQ